jgi:hypothetical protein
MQVRDEDRFRSRGIRRRKSTVKVVEAMTRDQALGLYRPIRASTIRRILPAAIRVCSQSDVMFGFAGGTAPRLSRAAVICKWFR